MLVDLLRHETPVNYSDLNKTLTIGFEPVGEGGA